MENKTIPKHYKISFIGYGNVSYRLSIALKMCGHQLDYICGRDIHKASKLAYILNKPEYTINQNNTTLSTDKYDDVLNSDVVIIAVSDNAIEIVSKELLALSVNLKREPVVLHTSGSTPLSILDGFEKKGVLYPMMTLSITKPVDFSIVPFFLESSSELVSDVLVKICYSLNSEYRFVSSQERAKLHVAAVFVSNFVNYLIGLSYDISTPNHMFLMPLALETIRKAFLYEHPALVQTGPAKRGDTDTIGKHIALLCDCPEHMEVYELLSRNIMNKNSKKE